MSNPTISFSEGLDTGLVKFISRHDAIRFCRKGETVLSVGADGRMEFGEHYKSRRLWACAIALWLLFQHRRSVFKQAKGA
jgi:hypothetical protein